MIHRVVPILLVKVADGLRAEETMCYMRNIFFVFKWLQRAFIGK